MHNTQFPRSYSNQHPESMHSRLAGVALAAFDMLPLTIAAALHFLPDLGILANSSRLLKWKRPELPPPGNREISTNNCRLLRSGILQKLFPPSSSCRPDSTATSPSIFICIKNSYMHK